VYTGYAVFNNKKCITSPEGKGGSDTMREIFKGKESRI
jgi:hypothetical protein